METLKQKLGIKEVEFCKFPYAFTNERVPLIFLEFDGKRETLPLRRDVLNFLRKQYPNIIIPEAQEVKDIVDIARMERENPLVHHNILSEPDIFRVDIACKSKTDTTAKIWFFEGYQRYNGEKINREELAKNYIERLKGLNGR